MPTHSEEACFLRDFVRLGSARQARFLAVLAQFVAGLDRGEFSPRLRVKRVVSHPGVWELSWGADDRATFHFGTEVRSGEPHIVWRRIGTHDIFRDP